jgi:putative hydrolase of the HAD superfamily
MISIIKMIDALLFDLDNTLYSENSGLEHNVAERMNHFVAEYLGVSVEAAMRIRHEGVRQHGTSLEWLVFDMGFKDTERYFQVIHPEGEEEALDADPGLRELLLSISLPKAVLTNAPMEHAKRILSKLGVSDCFSRVYDIRYNKLKGKPDPAAYKRVLADWGRSIESTLFIDDMPKYVKGFSDMGGKAILKDESGRFADLGLESIRKLGELPGLLEKWSWHDSR